MNRRTKYNSRKVIVSGAKFDSTREYERYCELLLQQKAGCITGLQRQVKFLLTPARRLENGKTERKSEYVADFVYVKDGKKVVEDSKGYRTREYILKRKFMLYLYGIEIHETK